MTAEQIIQIIRSHKAECQEQAASYADLSRSRYLPQQKIARKLALLTAETERLELILQEIGEPAESSGYSRTQDCVSRLCTVGVGA